jgi:hypothetical protein
LPAPSAPRSYPTLAQRPLRVPSSPSSARGGKARREHLPLTTGGEKSHAVNPGTGKQPNPRCGWEAVPAKINAGGGDAARPVTSRAESGQPATDG